MKGKNMDRGEKSIIEVGNITKDFRLFPNKRSMIKQLGALKGEKYYKEMKVLKNISFELKRGDSLGIIGKNGSGKSTLLQIICGILQPTSGYVKVNGRIAALLELGSGFNPEFTGKENVFLNASLLGLKKKEIIEKYDEIVEFSEIGEYIDQPTRTYSSGMIVRLAFSIIMHVNADILVIDEALSVGDAYFTQKCMRFIKRFKENGTLIFVSHDANAVLSLCNRALLLDKNRKQIEGRPKEIMEEYTRRLQEDRKDIVSHDEIKDDEVDECKYEMNTRDYKGINCREKDRWRDYRSTALNSGINANTIRITKMKQENRNIINYGGDKGRITKTLIRNEESGERIQTIMGGEVVVLTIDAEILAPVKGLITGFLLKNSKGLTLLGDNTMNALPAKMVRQANRGDKIETKFIFTLPLLSKGEYSITVALASGSQDDHEIIHWVNDALILKSECSSIAAGLAGVPMHTIEMEKI